MTLSWTHNPVRPPVDFRPRSEVLHIHPDLTRKHSSSRTEWDVSRHPSQGYKYDRGSIVSLNFTDTVVPVRCTQMTIKFADENTKDAMERWGPIHVTQVDGKSITVEAVMHAVYEFLQRRVQWADYNHLSSEGQRAVSDCFYRRCHAMGDHGRTELSQGIRRVDFLRGFTRFGGFSVDSRTLDGIGGCDLFLKLKPARRLKLG